jgi:hypothetical protein
MVMATKTQQVKSLGVRCEHGPTHRAQHAQRNDSCPHVYGPFEVRGSAPKDTILMAVTAPHARDLTMRFSKARAKMAQGIAFAITGLTQKMHNDCG